MTHAESLEEGFKELLRQYSIMIDDLQRLSALCKANLHQCHQEEDQKTAEILQAAEEIRTRWFFNQPVKAESTNEITE